MAADFRSIQTLVKQKEHNEVAPNIQLQKEAAIGDAQRKEKVEEPKYRYRSVEDKRTQQSNYNENKAGKYYGENEQLNINSENWINMLCDK